jgi:heat shock protein HslJ
MRAAAIMLTAVVTVACGSQGTPTPMPSADARVNPEGSWELVTGTVHGERIPLVDDVPITLTITGAQVGGSAACNSYGGRLAVVDGRFSIDDVMSTAMGCDAQLMAAEAAYLGALELVDAIEVEDDELVLGGPDVELRFAALPPPPTAELLDTEWVLDTLVVGTIGAAPVGDAATLRLRGDGTFDGATGCRTFEGTWVEAGEQIMATNLAMGDGSCAREVADQDTHVVSVIGDGFVPTLDGNLLTLTDPGGVGLVFRAAPVE